MEDSKSRVIRGYETVNCLVPTIPVRMVLMLDLDLKNRLKIQIYKQDICNMPEIDMPLHIAEQIYPIP